MSEGYLLRLLTLIKDDPELHDALVEFIQSKAEANRALAEYRKSRTK